MSKVTLSMIVKNEEKYLRECLESAKEITNEIILVDTGSTDKTVEIAKEFGAKIYHFKWINDFSAARNFALSKSRGDWILYLDADERISKKSLREFKEVIKSPNKVGVKCLVNSVDTFRKSSQLMKYVRLFRNDNNISFVGKAHEQIEQSLMNNNYKIIDSNIEIIHYGYDVPEDKLKEKSKRNLELLLLDYSKHKSSYLAYQIANSYSILKDEQNKNFYYLEALKDSNLNKEFKSICYLHLADYEMRTNDLSKAKEIIDAGLKLDNQNPLLFLLGTQIYGKLNDFNKALQLCKEALYVNEKLKLGISKSFNQSIQIDNKKIIFQAILISKLAKDQNEFESFTKLLHKNECKILTKVNNSEMLDIPELNFLINFTDEDNLELILKLLENFIHLDQKKEYLSSIYPRFNTSSKLASYYGSFLLSVNKNDLAEIIFETALDLENYDDSIIFYLSSIYIGENNYEKLILLLEKAEKRAEHNINFKNKLELLKEKLSPIFS